MSRCTEVHLFRHVPTTTWTLWASLQSFVPEPEFAVLDASAGLVVTGLQ